MESLRGSENSSRPSLSQSVIVDGEMEFGRDRGLSSLSGSVLETEESKSGERQMVRFKMIMIGDLSAGKSDMMAKYFDRNPHDMFMSLTEGGMI